jgi:hypothetical protein
MVITVLLLMSFHIMSVLFLNDSVTQIRISFHQIHFFLFTTTANVQVDTNFTSHLFLNMNFIYVQMKNLGVCFMNLLMCLTDQCWPRCTVRTFNSSHVACLGAPYGNKNVYRYYKCKTPSSYVVVGI